MFLFLHTICLCSVDYLHVFCCVEAVPGLYVDNCMCSAVLEVVRGLQIIYSTYLTYIVFYLTRKLFYSAMEVVLLCSGKIGRAHV